jgi:5-bromo-4-chloroindolyl phosphate hydrolysis protein
MEQEILQQVPGKFMPHNGITNEQIDNVVALMDQLIALQAMPLYESNNLANTIRDLYFYVMELQNAQNNQRNKRYHAIPHDGT